MYWEQPLQMVSISQKVGYVSNIKGQGQPVGQSYKISKLSWILLCMKIYSESVIYDLLFVLTFSKCSLLLSSLKGSRWLSGVFRATCLLFLEVCYSFFSSEDLFSQCRPCILWPACSVLGQTLSWTLRGWRLVLMQNWINWFLLPFCV